MSTDREHRTHVAAGLLGCAPQDVQARVRDMTPAERGDLTGHIDSVIRWVGEYEAEEARLAGVAA